MEPPRRQGSVSHLGGLGSIPTQTEVYQVFFSILIIDFVYRNLHDNFDVNPSIFTCFYSSRRRPFFVPSFGHAAADNPGFLRNGAYIVFALITERPNLTYGQSSQFVLHV